MSAQIENKLSDKHSSTLETVEEAVLKYVGEELTDGNEKISKSDIEKEKFLKDGKGAFTEISVSSVHLNDEISPNNSNDTKDSNINHTDPNSNKDHSSSNDNASDMTWYLRHDEDVSSTKPNQIDSSNVQQKIQSNQDSINQNTLALAAVVAAYQADKLNKLKRKNDNVADFIDTNATTDPQDNMARESLHSSRSFKKGKIHRHNEERNEVNNDYIVKKFRVGLKRNKSRLLVDPELTTLDDPSSQHQLVNKAIAEADSISQQPDFQQYLNTEADMNHGLSKLAEHNGDNHSDNNNNNKSMKYLKTAVESDRHVPLEENLSQKVFHDFPGITSEPAITIINVTSNKSNKKKFNTEKVNQATIDADNALLERAAAKASELIGSLASTQTSGKAFDAYEEAALDQFIKDYETIKKFTRRETCERIWTNGRRKDDFWINICKVLPYRTRSSIYKHIRRRYHIFEQRGKWTPQEDQQLADLCIDKEGQWSVIGKIMDRMPEDCRDRWRNYIKCGNNRISNKWSPEEESMLKRIISTMLEEANKYYDRKNEEAIDPNNEENRQLRNPGYKTVSAKPAFKDIINWTVVSERMGGTRSRIQCRYKWNKIIKKQALSKIELIPISEKRWLMEKLRDLGFTDESQVDWDELASLQGTKWTGLELKICYEKMKTMVKAYKELPVNEIAKSLLEILPDDNIITDKEE